MASIGESARVRGMLVAVSAGAVVLVLLAPLATVLAEALPGGWTGYAAAIASRDSLSAIRLTFLVAAIVVPMNTVFGLQGWFGAWLVAHGITVIFATPAIVLATALVTVPYVARQVIPLMQAQGSEQEMAALTLGASGWQIFRRITLPRLRWGLLNGVLLCNARGMGEFGAVSVGSGHISGLTMTIPLQIELLYNEYDLPAAFAMASLLAGIAVLTLAIKAVAERQQARQAG